MIDDYIDLIQILNEINEINLFIIILRNME